MRRGEAASPKRRNICRQRKARPDLSFCVDQPMLCPATSQRPWHTLSASKPTKLYLMRQGTYPSSTQAVPAAMPAGFEEPGPA